MEYFKISLTGDLGSGKSTVSEILKNRFNAEIVSVGKVQRKFATELGMNICEFNVYQQTHPEFDTLLDTRISEYENVEGNFIFDSRLAWHFVPDAFSVYMKCGYEESARRIMAANRTDEKFESVEEAEKSIRRRRESERERYKNFYDVDILDLNNYDMVVDTKDKTPEEVADAIENGWKKYIENKRK